jgi:hypothetical protein
MHYLYGIIVMLSFMSLSTWAAAFLGRLLAAVYVLLAVLLCSDYIIIGLGGVLGNVFNIIITQKYINRTGSMSNAPRRGVSASVWYLFIFIVAAIIKYAFGLEMNNESIWYFYGGGLLLWFLDPLFSTKNSAQSVDDYFDSVVKFEIIEKYKEDPKWATYLYFNDGHEDWNKTIKGSYRAKHPSNDLTFVFETKEEAINCAKRCFKNAICLND